MLDSSVRAGAGAPSSPASISSIRARNRSASRSSRRAGCTCWRRRPGRSGATRASSTKRSIRSTSTRSRRRRRRHRHSHGQRAARLRDRPRGARSAARGWCSAAFTPRCFRTKRASTARRTRSSRATATSSGRSVVADCFAGRAAAAVRRRPHRRRSVRVRALGSAAERPLHVGVGADRARLPEALLVLFGLANRRPGAAAARRRSRRPRDRRAAPSRLPLHRARRRQLLSGDVRRIWRRRGAAPITSRLHELEALRAGAIRADGAARRAAGRSGVLHADHDGGGRGCRVPRRDADARTSAARSSASSR